MTRKFVLLAGCLVLHALLALGLSRASRGEDEWLPISPENLGLKDNPASPGAHAMILYREDYIDAAGSVETEYIRTRIFTEKGKENGDAELEYVNAISNISDIRARTIRPDGSVVDFDGKIYDKEIVKSNGIRVAAKTFSLPDVQPGGIIEYKYREQHNPNFYWDIKWGVQRDLFTRLARFSIKPSNLPGAPPLYWRAYRIPTATKPELQKDGTLAMEIHDIPGLEVEDFMPPEDSLRATISFFYRSRYSPPNETADHFWQTTGKFWFAEDERFIGKRGALESLVSQTVAPNDPPEIKLMRLYARAQQIHNLWYDAAKTAKEEKREKTKENNNVEDVIKRGYATGFQINRLMVGLARTAGFDSALIYTASRNDVPFFANTCEKAFGSGASKMVTGRRTRRPVEVANPGMRTVPSTWIGVDIRGSLGSARRKPARLVA